MGKFDRIKKVIKSLRFKIVMIILVAGILPATCLTMLIINQYENLTVDSRIQELQRTASLLRTEKNSPSAV